MLSHQNLVVNVVQQRHWLNDAKRGGETILGVLPLSHSYGMTGCMNLAMALAASLDPDADEPHAGDPQRDQALPADDLPRRADDVPRRSPTSRMCAATASPRFASASAARRRCRSRSRRRSSSSPVARLVEGYGLTEAVAGDALESAQAASAAVGSIGVPLPSTERAHRGSANRRADLPPGEVGELEVRGPQVMQGYWKRPDETAAGAA